MTHRRLYVSKHPGLFIRTLRCRYGKIILEPAMMEHLRIGPGDHVFQLPQADGEILLVAGWRMDDIEQASKVQFTKDK